jgi:hypothetical protein
MISGSGASRARATWLVVVLVQVPDAVEAARMVCGLPMVIMGT